MKKMSKNFTRKALTVDAMACYCAASCQCPTTCACTDITNYYALDSSALKSGTATANVSSIKTSNSVWG